MREKFPFLLALVLMASAALPIEMAHAVTQARPPLGLQIFCLQNPVECRPASAAVAQHSDDLLHVLGEVNRSVNRAIRPARDTRVDDWQVGASSGDCEDYVMTKRAKLIAKGVPRGALLIAYTHSRTGEGHAVLVVRTTHGDLVLDNLVNDVKTLAASRYTIERISTSNLLRWSYH